jgi:uncharacterized protein
MKYDRDSLLTKIMRDSTSLETESHAPDHWIRVAGNGVLLAEAEGVDPVFCEIFGLLHDCQRIDDGVDPGHGQRAAAYASRIRKMLPLEPHEFHMLLYALVYHDEKIKAPGVKIGCCWDADRLDLVRFGRRPDPRYLNTSTAKKAAKA